MVSKQVEVSKYSTLRYLHMYCSVQYQYLLYNVYNKYCMYFKSNVNKNIRKQAWDWPQEAVNLHQVLQISSL